MRYFNYQAREYVPTVDLAGVQRTYDRLEEGHKEAIKTAAELKTSIAALDMHESEDEFKNKLVNSIDDVVRNNTEIGNAYFALDDLIKTSGDITSNPGVIGRLRAKKDYDEFVNSVNSNQTLTQRTKDYYIAINPYKYEDKIDEKTGMVIGGSKWSATKKPTNTIDWAKIIQSGIALAAKEAGGGANLRFINADGNITNNPMEAVSGEFYNKTTNNWERLSEDKISAGIEAYIKNTPGALESLQQDYDVANWDLDRQRKDRNDPNLTSEVTDGNGLRLSFQEYLDNRINPAVYAARYYNSFSDVQWGGGVKAYQQARQAAAGTAAQQEINSLMTGTNAPTNPEQVTINAPVEFNNRAIQSKAYIQQRYKELTGRTMFFDDKPIDVQATLDVMKRNGVTDSELNIMRSHFQVYKNAQENIRQMRESITNDKDRQQFDFALRMLSGGGINSSNNGGSKEDDNILTKFKNVGLDKGKGVQMSLSNSDINNIIDIIDLNSLGIKRNGNILQIPKSNLMGALSVLDVIDSKGIAFTINAYDDNGVIKNTGYTQLSNSFMDNFVRGRGYKDGFIYTKQLLKDYRNANKIINDINSKYGIMPTEHTFVGVTLSSENPNQGVLWDMYNSGRINKEEYKLNVDEMNKLIQKDFTTAGISQAQIAKVSDNGVSQWVTNSGDKYTIEQQINAAAAKGDLTYNLQIIPGTNGLFGKPQHTYQVQVPIYDEDGKKTGQYNKYTLKGFISQTADRMIVNDPGNIGASMAATTYSTRTTRNLLDKDEFSTIGQVNLTGQSGQQGYLTFNGGKIPLTLEEAGQVSAFSSVVQQCKESAILNGGISEREQSSLNMYINKFANIVGASPEAIQYAIYTDINNAVNR